MSIVVNKATLEIICNAHTPNYDTRYYLINPTFPGCASKYFKVHNDAIVEMSTEEKAIVDNNTLATECANARADNKACLEEYVELKFPLLEREICWFLYPQQNTSVEAKLTIEGKVEWLKTCITKYSANEALINAGNTAIDTDYSSCGAPGLGMDLYTEFNRWRAE
jgi:hypothetical protein